LMGLCGIGGGSFGCPKRSIANDHVVACRETNTAERNEMGAAGGRPLNPTCTLTSIPSLRRECETQLGEYEAG
jgi:hypothetical protein